MKLLLPAVAAVGLSSAHSDVEDKCENLSNMKGMKKCLKAILMEMQQGDQAMDKWMGDMEAAMEEKVQPQHITVEGDYYSGTCDDRAVEESSEPETEPESEPETEGEACPNKFGEQPNMTVWTMKDFHYYMNCKDEVQVRIYRDKLEWDAANPGKSYLPLDSGKYPDMPILDEPFYKNCDNCSVWNQPTPTLAQLINDGAIPNPDQDRNPWAWMNADYFLYLVSDHGVSMMSWGTPAYKDYWKMKLGWYKDDIADWQEYIWGYEQNIVYKFCSGLPKSRLMWGTPIREDGTNPMYPYTSWRNEGFNSTAADADANFLHGSTDINFYGKL